MKHLIDDEDGKKIVINKNIKLYIFSIILHDLVTYEYRYTWAYLSDGISEKHFHDPVKLSAILKSETYICIYYEFN